MPAKASGAGPSLLPRAEGEVPAQNHSFRDFAGINTQAARQAIQPNQFSWLENIMPIGPGNLLVVPAPSDARASLAGLSIYYRHEYNISNTAYLFLACTDGSAYQMLAMS